MALTHKTITYKRPKHKAKPKTRVAMTTKRPQHPWFYGVGC